MCNSQLQINCVVNRECWLISDSLDGDLIGLICKSIIFQSHPLIPGRESRDPERSSVCLKVTGWGQSSPTCSSQGYTTHEES